MSKSYEDNLFSSISSESTSFNKKSKITKSKNKLDYTKILRNTYDFIKNGYWVEVKNATKKGPKTFIKHLNRYTSYNDNERNHTFSLVLYRQSTGHSFINFLNKNMAAQLIYERQGVNWIGQNDSNDDEIQDENKSEDEEEIQDENESEEINENIHNFIPCEIKKIKINSKKLLKYFRENPRKRKKRKYIIFHFTDTEKAKEYFSHIIF